MNAALQCDRTTWPLGISAFCDKLPVSHCVDFHSRAAHVRQNS
jgi:hypothetical protein